MFMHNSSRVFKHHGHHVSST